MVRGWFAHQRCRQARRIKLEAMVSRTNKTARSSSRQGKQDQPQAGKRPREVYDLAMKRRRLQDEQVAARSGSSASGISTDRQSDAPMPGQVLCALADDAQAVQRPEPSANVLSPRVDATRATKKSATPGMDPPTAGIPVEVESTAPVSGDVVVRDDDDSSMSEEQPPPSSGLTIASANLQVDTQANQAVGEEAIVHEGAAHGAKRKRSSPVAGIETPTSRVRTREATSSPPVVSDMWSDEDDIPISGLARKRIRRYPAPLVESDSSSEEDPEVPSVSMQLCATPNGEARGVEPGAVEPSLSDNEEPDFEFLDVLPADLDGSLTAPRHSQPTESQLDEYPECAVSRIMGRRDGRAELEYLVQWEDLSSEWLGLSRLENCEALVSIYDRYITRHPDKRVSYAEFVSADLPSIGFMADREGDDCAFHALEMAFELRGVPRQNINTLKTLAAAFLETMPTDRNGGMKFTELMRFLKVELPVTSWRVDMDVFKKNWHAGQKIGPAGVADAYLRPQNKITGGLYLVYAHKPSRVGHCVLMVVEDEQMYVREDSVNRGIMQHKWIRNIVFIRRLKLVHDP